MLNDAPSAADVDDGRSGRGDLARARSVIVGVERRADLAVAAIGEILAAEDRERDRRDVVQVRVVVKRDAARDLRGHLERIATADLRSSFELEPAQARAPAVAEEKEVGL